MSSVAERWRSVDEFPEYEVSDLGRVRRVDSGHLLAATIARNGYPTVKLWARNHGHSRRVHRLVALAFCDGRTAERDFVNHIDGVRANVGHANLEWCTISENQLHAVWVTRTLTPPVMHGTDNVQHRPVFRIDRASGAEVRFETMTLAASEGFDIRGIYAACCGEQKTHYGYGWRYAAGPTTANHNRAAA